jgi:hypothetical protein
MKYFALLRWGTWGLKRELKLVAVMTLSASFAFVMFHSFRRGKAPARTSDEFLYELAEIKNTSIECCV